jgi:hypothetical protein
MIVTRSFRVARSGRGSRSVSLERGVPYRAIAIILLGGAPHILVIHQITGLSWPNLPKGWSSSSAA